MVPFSSPSLPVAFIYIDYGSDNLGQPWIKYAALSKVYYEKTFEILNTNVTRLIMKCNVQFNRY